MYPRKKLFCVLYVLLFLASNLFAVRIGSDTAVSREGSPLFPTDQNDTNEMYGFAAFEQGFMLENLATYCSFNAFFPVSGEVGLQGGTLGLAQDLIFTDGIDVVTTGTFEGNGHAMIFQERNDLHMPSEHIVQSQ